MRRVVAALCAAAMLSVPGSTAWQHVHAYDDHEHDQHQHGPALHSHESEHGEANDSTAPRRLESCEPGAHAVSVLVAYLTPDPLPTPTPAIVDQVPVAWPAVSIVVVSRDEARAHGPPRLDGASLRGPPLHVPA